LEGHLKDANYGADWGDFVSFSNHMKAKARAMGVDMLLIDTGMDCIAFNRYIGPLTFSIQAISMTVPG
jgi:hypothetical protein